MHHYYMGYASPVGRLRLVAEDEHLIRLELPDNSVEPANIVEERTPLLQEVKAQLDAYFDGKLTAFQLPLNPKGTLFQQQVWQALAQIPYGVTQSYKYLAEVIGKPTAYRAVGMANRVNPLPIILPCHRIIAHNGGLCGYAGGLMLKEWLLTHEKQPFIVQHDSEKSYLAC